MTPQLITITASVVIAVFGVLSGLIVYIHSVEKKITEEKLIATNTKVDKECGAIKAEVREVVNNYLSRFDDVKSAIVQLGENMSKKMDDHTLLLEDQKITARQQYLEQREDLRGLRDYFNIKFDNVEKTAAASAEKLAKISAEHTIFHKQLHGGAT